MHHLAQPACDALHFNVCADAYALPVEGTETRVNAQSEAYEYIVDFGETSKVMSVAASILECCSKMHIAYSPLCSVLASQQGVQSSGTRGVAFMVVYEHPEGSCKGAQTDTALHAGHCRAWGGWRTRWGGTTATRATAAGCRASTAARR